MPDAEDESGSESEEELPSDAKIVGQPRSPNTSKYFESEALRKKVARWKQDPPSKSFWTDKSRQAAAQASLACEKSASP